MTVVSQSMVIIRVWNASCGPGTGHASAGGRGKCPPAPPDGLPSDSGMLVAKVDVKCASPSSVFVMACAGRGHM